MERARGASLAPAVVGGLRGVAGVYDVTTPWTLYRE